MIYHKTLTMFCHFELSIETLIPLSSVQFSCSVMSDFLWPHELQHARPPCPSPNPRVYPNMSTESVMPSNHLILCRPLLLPPSIIPSIRVFSNKSVLCIRWPKYWSFSFSITPSNEYSGLIYFRMDWLDLLTVQGTLKSLLDEAGLTKTFQTWPRGCFHVATHPRFPGPLLIRTRCPDTSPNSTL